MIMNHSLLVQSQGTQGVPLFTGAYDARYIKKINDFYTFRLHILFVRTKFH